MPNSSSSVSDVLSKRFSVRAFKSTPVPHETLNEIFTLARQVPSNCNVQPSQAYVVSGASKDRLKEEFTRLVTSGVPGNPDFEWMVKFEGEHRERQVDTANALYSAMGIERSDKERRQAVTLRNWSFFDAPHAAFFTMAKYLKLLGAVDLGIYAQTLALLMAERGISCCIQGALNQYPAPARKMFGLPDDVGILFGMSFGYADESAPANQTRTNRAPLESVVRFFD